MNNYPVGKLVIRDNSIEVFVNDSGIFNTEYNGARFHAESKEALRQQLMAASRKAVKVAIEFDRIEYDSHTPTRVRRGVVTGIHAKNQNLLVRWYGKKAEQIDGYGQREMLKPLSRAEADEWIQLYEAKRDAIKAYDLFVRKHGFAGGLRQVVREAVAAETAKAQQTEEAS